MKSLTRASRSPGSSASRSAVPAEMKRGVGHRQHLRPPILHPAARLTPDSAARTSRDPRVPESGAPPLRSPKAAGIRRAVREPEGGPPGVEILTSVTDFSRQAWPLGSRFPEPGRQNTTTVARGDTGGKRVRALQRLEQHVRDEFGSPVDQARRRPGRNCGSSGRPALTRSAGLRDPRPRHATADRSLAPKARRGGPAISRSEHSPRQATRPSRSKSSEATGGSMRAAHNAQSHLETGRPPPVVPCWF